MLEDLDVATEYVSLSGVKVERVARRGCCSWARWPDLSGPAQRRIPCRITTPRRTWACSATSRPDPRPRILAILEEPGQTLTSM